MKVYTTKDNVKKYIYHPIGRQRFDANGMADWPDDQFTRRRLRDGDITLEPAPVPAIAPTRKTEKAEK